MSATDTGAWEPTATDLGLWEPPDVGPDEVLGPPDFVGVGVQRCGTTRWYELLCLHPEVHHPSGRQKELHHFDLGWHHPEPLADPVRYATYFPRPAGRLAGEWTPRYLTDPWTPPLLARAAPRARVLVLLRDPIERLASALAHEGARGSAPPTWIVADAAARGHYDRHLERLLRHVPAERVLVQLHEACIDDPARELARTQAFLGLEAHLPDADALGRRVNARRGGTAPPSAVDALPRSLVDALRDEYADVVTRLQAMRPDLDLGRWTTTVA